MDVRDSQFKTRTPSTERSQHWAVSRAEEQRPSWRSWMGPAAARPAKAARMKAVNCILLYWWWKEVV